MFITPTACVECILGEKTRMSSRGVSEQSLPLVLVCLLRLKMDNRETMMKVT